MSAFRTHGTIFQRYAQIKDGLKESTLNLISANLHGSLALLTTLHLKSTESGITKLGPSHLEPDATSLSMLRQLLDASSSKILTTSASNLTIRPSKMLSP